MDYTNSDSFVIIRVISGHNKFKINSVDNEYRNKI